ncbi:MAG: capsular polysaccharide synthesis protein [[Pasteurella] mairii]|uniref:Capsular polysaccharide synthesis protein n=1 Tax=[Pasteurella] mairii TaxID=757 RepID=A0A379B392_9PAST|nr:capsular polysaccharide synthesis protein [[Pasteurella] mairii]SUB32540.1 Capsular polysaccharide synthesis protein [[Pasteurella] mairii]
MEVKNKLISKIIEKTIIANTISAEFFNEQKISLDKMKENLANSKLKLTRELFGLASEIGKNGLRNQATKIEESIVNSLLFDAPYNAKLAFATHNVMFSERHEMAMFLYENLSEIKENVTKSHKKNKITSNTSNKIKIFTYWDNESNLPFIVEKCRASLKKYINTEYFELIILNKNSYKAWTDFRQENINANITQAHFTDLLRMKLLEKWGGVWLDATCLLIQDFYLSIQEIIQQEHFLFSYTKSRTGTWFIYSKPNNYVISMISEAIQLWWKKKGYLTNYFMLHDVIEMLYWIDPEYQRQWNNNKKIHPRPAVTLVHSYEKDFTEDAFNLIVNNSFIHKLTYKYDINKVIKNSVLDQILSGQIEKAIRKRNNHLDMKEIQNKTFVFSRKDGTFSRKMYLAENGVIDNIGGKGHDNEYYWEILNNSLVIKNKAREVSSIFKEIFYYKQKIYLNGYFKNDISIQFNLRESD